MADDTSEIGGDELRIPHPADPHEAINKVVKLASDGLWCDGDHHKQWYLEQILRVLFGEHYDQAVAAMTADEDGNPNTYNWEPGVAP